MAQAIRATCIWAQATGAWIDALNAENYAGYSDWRLQNVRELISIVDYSVVNPSIDTLFFSPTAVGIYWSSTTLASSPLGAWRVFFGSGLVDDAGKGLPLHVRAVRGGR